MSRPVSIVMPLAWCVAIVICRNSHYYNSSPTQCWYCVRGGLISHVHAYRQASSGRHAAELCCWILLISPLLVENNTNFETVGGTSIVARSLEGVAFRSIHLSAITII